MKLIKSIVLTIFRSNMTHNVLKSNKKHVIRMTILHHIIKATSFYFHCAQKLLINLTNIQCTTHIILINDQNSKVGVDVNQKAWVRGWLNNLIDYFSIPCTWFIYKLFTMNVQNFYDFWIVCHCSTKVGITKKICSDTCKLLLGHFALASIQQAHWLSQFWSTRTCIGSDIKHFTDESLCRNVPS